MGPAVSSSAFHAPGPFRVIETFLGDDMVQRLLDHVLLHQDRFKPTKVNVHGAAQVKWDRRISMRLGDWGDLRPLIQAQIVGVKDWAVQQLGITPFHTTQLEMEMVAHGDGAFFSRHTDTHMNPDHTPSWGERTLTAVYYFHALPKAYDGGQLRMHSLVPPEAGGTHVDLVPQRDMLLLFPSWFPHEVMPISCAGGHFMQSRFAINCWFSRQPQRS